MQSSDNVVNRIIELDAVAERFRAQAREKAENAGRETRARLAEEKAGGEQRVSERIARIEAEASKKRSAEIETVRADYAAQAAAVKNVSSDRMERAVNMVLTRIKETSA